MSTFFPGKGSKPTPFKETSGMNPEATKQVGVAAAQMENSSLSQYAQIVKKTPIRDIGDSCHVQNKAALRCKNGGTCVLGERPTDLFEGLDDVTSAWLDNHLNDYDFSQDGGMYCKCAEGWTGPYCDTKIVICGENEHLCLGGGVCIQNGLDEEDEKYYCACGKYSHKPPEVGHMCEFVADTSCELHDKYSDHSYCTNGGKCIDTIQDQMAP